VILIDSNIFMYAAGTEHPFKRPSGTFLERVARNETEAAIDAEVLQEILHRYRALQRWEEGARLFSLTRRIVPLVLPVTGEVMDGAKTLLDRYPHLAARDAVHAAVASLHGIPTICSYDRDFDSVEGVDRIEP